MTLRLRFYLDENVPVEVARQLRGRGIDAMTAGDMGLLGAPDERHFAAAADAGCVLCTYDADFLRIAASGIEHAGIVFGQQVRHYVGDWVNALTLLHAVYSVEEMRNRIEFL